MILVAVEKKFIEVIDPIKILLEKYICRGYLIEDVKLHYVTKVIVLLCSDSTFVLEYNLLRKFIDKINTYCL